MYMGTYLVRAKRGVGIVPQEELAHLEVDAAAVIVKVERDMQRGPLLAIPHV